jgi:cytosine permease
MNNQPTQATGQLPGYITSATPNPPDNRAPWYKNTAPTYAGIFLWFVFWFEAMKSETLGGGLAAGLGVALLGLVLAGLICHFLFYLVPGLLGQKTGLPLYIVGTSTFGATGGFLMPGFLMGVLQFGWLGVNIFFSSQLLAMTLPVPSQVIMIVWGVLAAFVGLKGIQYVAKVATYIPLIPLGVLLVMLVKTAGTAGSFDAQILVNNIHPEVAASGIMTASPSPAMSTMLSLAFILTYVVGFFATAGAAGVDFGTNSRHGKDVNMGGLVGIALAVILTAGLSTIIVAGTYGSKEYGPKAVAAAKAAVAKAVSDADAAAQKAGKPMTDEAKEQLAVAEAANALYRSTNLISVLLGDKAAKWLMFLLALAAFPPACFSSFIAANSFKTTLPKVNPFISVGLGTAVSILLAVTGWAGNAVGVFKIIGASFGPICGAMLVDYLLSGGNWSGPRAAFNPAGWISWLLGFCVGIAGQLGQFITFVPIPEVPAAPVAAFVVGAVVYFICFKIGLKSAVVPIPAKS